MQNKNKQVTGEKLYNLIKPQIHKQQYKKTND